MRTTLMNDMLYRCSNFQRKKNRNIQFQYLRRTKEMMLSESQEINLDYLSFYPENLQQKIKDSLRCPIPQPLPPLAPQTISFYRRSSKPIFQTRPLQSNQLDYHMVCQSLYLLAKLDKDLYPNYNGLVKQFQREFKLYIELNSKQIFQIATTAAGNKVLGSYNDVLQLVNKYPDQVWVLINHCYAGKISYKYLQPFLLQGNHYVLKLFYEFSNQKGHESIYYLMDNEDIIQSMFKTLNSNDLDLKLYVIRILGNICGQDSIEESVSKDITYNISLLLKFNILDHLFPILMTSNQLIRKDTYWLLSNLSCHEEAATAILRKSKIVQKLMQKLYYESNLKIKKNLIFIFYFLGELGQKQTVFQLFINKNFLQMLSQLLTINDTDIIEYILGLMKRLIDLGSQFLDQNQQNIVILMLQKQEQFKKGIERYQFSDHHQISAICAEIMLRIGQNKDMMEGEI